MDWSNDLVLEFLDLYEMQAPIWSAKHLDHKNRTKVADCWKKIQDEFSLKLSINELKKKKESLMSTFRPLLQKYKQGIKSGAGASCVYQPNWFAFQRMYTFLQSVYEPKTTIHSEESCGDADDRLNYNVERDTDDDIIPHGPLKKPKLKQKHNVQQQMDEAYNIMKKLSSEVAVDECALYGNLMTVKLRSLSDSTRETVMREIDEIIFRARQANIPPNKCSKCSSQINSNNIMFSNEQSQAVSPPVELTSASQLITQRNLINISQVPNNIVTNSSVISSPVYARPVTKNKDDIPLDDHNTSVHPIETSQSFSSPMKLTSSSQLITQRNFINTCSRNNNVYKDGTALYTCSDTNEKSKRKFVTFKIVPSECLTQSKSLVETIDPIHNIKTETITNSN